MNHTNSNPSILLESGTNEVEFLLISLGAQRYGINVSKVCQILVYNPATIAEIPNQYEEILGVTTFRDETISVLDLSVHLKRKDEQPANRLLIVTEFNQRRTGFVVDAVDRIERVSWTSFEPINNTSCNQSVASVLGTVRRADGLVLILDLESILALLDPSMNAERYGEDIPEATINRKDIRILHCEDSPLIQKMMMKVLSDGGFQKIHQVANGKLGIEALTSGESEFDIIISDIEMPVMDGLSFCKEVRKDQRFASLPLLFFSSMINDQMQQKCSAVGGTAAYAKPDLGKIVGAIEQHVSVGKTISK